MKLKVIFFFLTEISRKQSLIEDSFKKSQTTPKKIEDSRKSVKVTFSKDKTKDIFKEQEEVIEIVGQVKPEHFWAVQMDGKLLLLNHFRAQEVILYKKLMQTHAVTSIPIPKGPIGNVQF